MYEFFCNDCNTIFTFFARSINTETTPPCPKNQQHKLSRMVSRFAVTKRSNEGEESASSMPDLPIDEARMEQAMESLAAEAEGINEDDPRQAAQLMRKLTAMTGLKLGDKVEDALSRMESGADPDTIEQELGDIDENDLFSVQSSAKRGAHKTMPQRDETLYEM